MNIMFVCTGNICRSAMADWMMKKLAKDHKREDIKVFSSGVCALDGDHATQNAIFAAREYDVEWKEHRAINVRRTNMKDMNYIFGMTTSHKYELIQMYPELKDKIYTLKEFINLKDNKQAKDIDIEDPWGYDLFIYRKCATQIYDCLEKLIKYI